MTRRILAGVLLVALAAGIFGLLPRLGGLTRDAAGLRHARPAYLAVAIVAETISFGSYAQLYRRMLAALGGQIRFRLAADVILATFFVSHLTPFGSATGTLVNASALEAEGIPAATTGEAILLTSLTSTVGLIVLFGIGIGFAATAGRHVSPQYRAGPPPLPGTGDSRPGAHSLSGSPIGRPGFEKVMPAVAP